MKKNTLSSKRSRLGISRQNAIKNSDTVLYTRRLKTKRHKKQKELDPEPYAKVKGQDINDDPEDVDQHIPFKLRELMKYKNGKPSIYKPKEVKYKDETFVKQGKKESDRNYIKRTTVDFYKTVDETKQKISLEKNNKDPAKPSNRKEKRKERLQIRKAMRKEDKLDSAETHVYDKIAFGECIKAPPKFTVMPKMVVKKNYVEK